MPPTIPTHSTDSFRQRYLQPDSELNALFRDTLRDFFCLRLEVIRHDTKLPILPSREDAHTLILTTSGHFGMKIGFQSCRVTPDNLLIVSAGTVFSSEYMSSDLTGYSCHFRLDHLAAAFGSPALLRTDFGFLEVSGPPLLPLTTATARTLRPLFHRLQEQFHDPRAAPPLVAAYLYALLLEVHQLYGERPVTRQRQLTQRFQRLAHERIHEHPNVGDLARALDVTPNHLNKAVRTATGRSASVVLAEIRLIEIKYHLYQTERSVSEIAYELGFTDPSYFTRFFKRHEGMTPSEFRTGIEKYQYPAE